MSREATKDNYAYLASKPGLQLIKAGTYTEKPLNDLLGIPEVRSQIIDVPVTADSDAATLGFFSMQHAEKGFDFEYDYLEVKVVVSGRFVMSDQYGTHFTAQAGDVVIINNGSKVTFHPECDGKAVYVAHRLPEPTMID